MIRAATSISALTLLSRVLGLVRDVLTASILGVNGVSGAFVIAWMVPNLLRRLFGEGALSAAFVPAFTRMRETAGDIAAKRLLGGVSGILVATLVSLIAIVVIVTLVLPPDTWRLDGDAALSGTERGAVLSQLLALLFPYTLPVCLLAVYAGALNALGRFALPAAAPAVLNVFWIAGLLYAGADPQRDLVDIVRLVAIFMLCGGVAQLTLAAVPLWRRGMLPRPTFRVRETGAGAVFRTMAPAALGLSIVQLNLMIDQALAEVLVGPGANNHIYYANRLLLFPHALVALPLATALFPQLASLAAREGRIDAKALEEPLGRALRYTLFLSIPAAAGMASIAGDLVEVMFVRGRYTEADAQLTTLATVTLVAGLPALGTAQHLARTLFALGDTATPARIAALLVVLNVALNLLLVIGLDLGVAGLTIATTCTAYVNVALLRTALRHRGARLAIGIANVTRILIAASLMTAVILGFRHACPDTDWGIAKGALYVATPIVLGVAVYAGACRLLAVREFDELRAWLRARRRRRHS